MSKYNFGLNLEDRNSLSVLLKRIKPNSMILEFGPANGRMTKYMKEQLNCKIFAVEIDEKSAKDAEKYCEKMVVDSIEDYHWQKEFKDIKFDYIIFADVLEHLYSPEKVLDNVREFLLDSGCILVSIPNITHNSIIINLLKNEFKYNPTGLLDNTHIRFFTKKTFDELIEKTGYFTNYETAIFLNPENTEFRNSYDELEPEISEYLKNLPCGEIYQLIYEFGKTQIEKISDFSDNYAVYNKNFIQLFVENENTYFSEENSIKYSVSQTIELQRFEFDLKNFDNIKNLRLDPLNDSCVINIFQVYIVLEDNSQIDIKSSLKTNACSVHEDNYFFEFLDPNIYFENIYFESLSIKKFVVELIYNHMSKDAVIICKSELLENQRLEIENQRSEIENQRSEIENQKIELHKMLKSKSWKITAPLRIFINKLKVIINVKK